MRVNRMTGMEYGEKAGEGENTEYMRQHIFADHRYLAEARCTCFAIELVGIREIEERRPEVEMS